MPITQTPTGDDQAWKKEVARVIADLEAQVARFAELVRANR